MLDEHLTPPVREDDLPGTVEKDYFSTSSSTQSRVLLTAFFQLR